VKACVDLARVAGVEHLELQPDHLHRRLHVSDFEGGVRINGGHEHGDDGSLGSEFAQQVEPLLPERRSHQRHASGVAARPVETRNENRACRRGSKPGEHRGGAENKSKPRG
jgi:hypothetical protein